MGVDDSSSRKCGWKDGDPGNQVVWRNGKRRHIVTCYQQRRQSGTDASIAAFTAAARSTSPQWGTSPFTRRAKKNHSRPRTRRLAVHICQVAVASTFFCMHETHVPQLPQSL